MNEIRGSFDGINYPSVFLGQSHSTCRRPQNPFLGNNSIERNRIMMRLPKQTLEAQLTCDRDIFR